MLKSKEVSKNTYVKNTDNGMRASLIRQGECLLLASARAVVAKENGAQ
jgi:hypothetical protein